MSLLLSVPLSALQHALYCERQCALIHLERAWEENRFTAEGRVLHERSDAGGSERQPGKRVVRSLSVEDPVRGIHGVCDVVEFHADGRIVPVEFKRGRPKPHRADEVQLCAQALCLEAIFRRPVVAGALFYGKERRRKDVLCDDSLRALTDEIIRRTRELLIGPELPAASYERRKCEACSLIEICQPKAFRLRQPLTQWFWREIHAETQDDAP